jgi:RES domain-containing protein
MDEETDSVGLDEGVEHGATIGIVTIRAHTGRRVDCEESEYAEVQALAPMDLKVLASSAMGQKLAADIRGSLPLATIVGRTFFRGRPSSQNPKGWEEMGPPRKEYSREGRYNLSGTVVLYLASTIAGVRLELHTDDVCEQEYLLGGLKIADLTSDQLPGRLKAAFELAENADVDNRGGPTNFDLPHFLSNAISNAGYEGFLVPGVRGAVSSRYSNLVVFDPEPRWQDWSRRSVGFKALSGEELPNKALNPTVGRGRPPAG